MSDRNVVEASTPAPEESRGGGGGRGRRVGGGGKCYKCNEQGHMSRECPNEGSSGSGGGNRSCYKCGEEGHMSRDCTNESSGGGGKCYKSQEGHMARDCPTEGSSGSGVWKCWTMSCYNCGEEGHISRDCKNESSGGGGKSQEEGHMARDCPTEGSSGSGVWKCWNSSCYKCGEEGHISRDCTNESSGGGGKCQEKGHMTRDCPTEGDDGQAIGLIRRQDDTTKVRFEAETMDGSREGDGKVENDGNIRLDPFVQPPILKALFEQLPLEELAKCRLVSKLWLDESLSTWRSNAIVKIEAENPEDDGSRRASRNTTSHSLREFLDFWKAKEWGSCPFKKFSLHNWKFEAEDMEQEMFMALAGKNATSLTLSNCSFIGSDHFRRIMYQAFPKLQFFKIQRCNVDKVYFRRNPRDEILAYREPDFGVHPLKSLDMSGCCPHSMMDILSHFHKLRSLHMQSASVVTYRNLLQTITLIREHDPTKLPLKNFDVECRFTLGQRERTASSIELLELHECLNLPLQRLEISFCAKQIGESDGNPNFNNEGVIRNILQSHSSTLSSLKFISDWDSNNRREVRCKPFPFGFNFEKLEEMVLASTLCDNLNYLRYTPNLRLLQFEGAFPSMSESGELFSKSSQLELGDWTLPSLKYLGFGVPFSLSVRNLKKLMKWMPNLEQLSGIRLDDVKFSLVCQNWKHLKELLEFGFELTDEGVIGIVNDHEARNDDKETLIGPNITKLKKLTKFWTFSTNLTSASVHEGFLKLANLRELKLGELTRIDKEAVAALDKQEIGWEFSNWRRLQ